MKRDNPDRKIEIFLLFSLLLHLFLLFVGGWRLNLPSKTQALREVEVTLLPKHPYQIADIAPPAREEKPETPKFLGMYDSRVPEEQVAASPPRPRSPQKEAKRQEKREEKKLSETARQKKGQLVLKSPEKSVEERLSESAAEIGALPEDFYPNYKVGDHTYLNVLRYPAVSYFVRLKKIFKTTWNPNPVLRDYFYANRISKGQIEVVLGVSVDREGRLANLFVIRSSGLPHYDQEGLRTIRDSAPFAAPPKELLDPDGELRMSWTFTVYL